MSDPVQELAAALTDIKLAKEEAVPQGFNWHHISDVERGMEWAIVSIVLSNPIQIIEVAINDPDKLLQNQVPYGALKILYIGTEKQCIKKEKKYLDSNEYNRVLRIKTGIWLPIADISILKDKASKEMIDAKGRSLLFNKQLQVKHSYEDNKNTAITRSQIDEHYEQRKDDKDDVMHYVQLKINEYTVSERRTEALNTIEVSTKVLDSIKDKIQKVEQEHPEFIHEWKDELDTYCKDTRIRNPFN